MAIAYRDISAGTGTFGINGFSVPIPAGAVTGDMMLLFVGGKPYNANVSVSTAGWVQLGTLYASGTTAAGNDSGSPFATVWWKEHDGSEANPAIVEGSPAFNVVGGYIVAFSKGAGETWATPVQAGGGDATGSNISITTDADPGITAGDAICLMMSTPSDSDTPLSVDIDWTATGITAATDTQTPATEYETITGGDMSMSGVRSLSITGTSSAAPVITATLAAAHQAAAVMVRLRVSAVTAHERSAAFDAAVGLASAGTFFTVFSRAAALDAALAVASAPQRALLRSALFNATLGVASAPQRELLRAASLDAAVGIASSGSVLVVWSRSASFDAAVDVASSGTFFSVFERAAALGITADVASAGTFFSILERAAALGVAVDVASSATFFSTLERSAALDAALGIASAGVAEGPGAVVHERAAAFAATVDIVSAAEFFSVLERAAAIGATVTILTAHQRELERSAAIGALISIETTPQVAQVQQPPVVVGSRGWMYLFPRPTGRLTTTGNDPARHPRRKTASGRAEREIKWDEREE